MSVTISVIGTPAPQGSKNNFGGNMVESSNKLPAWRKAVRDQAKAHVGEGWEAMDGPLVVILDVYLPKPGRSKFGAHPAGMPDLDKLQRAIGDGLTAAGVIADDARIVRWVAEKHWAVDEAGATITIHPKGEL